MGQVNSPLLAEASPFVLDHHPAGASTGYMRESREQWPSLVDAATRISSFAVELAALDEAELPSLLDFLANDPSLPFRYLSVHAPTKGRRLTESELLEQLADLPPVVDAIVVHPDQIADPHPYRVIGARLVIENMDARKGFGCRASELEPLFDELPDAGFCFDVAHAYSVDETMAVGEELLDRFAGRLRHVHLSSITPEHGHVSLTREDEALFRPLLSRCRDVPWIFEAEPRPS